ncbi:putative F-box domain-containing protein [Tanacetum coccineum]
MPTYWKVPNESLFIHNPWKVVGSSNGLVCFSRVPTVPLILVNNPCTRELRKLPMPPLLSEKILPRCFSFGYDSSTDDYKLVMGTSDPTPNTIETLFQVLSLKSNTWKLVGEFTVINTEPVDSEYECVESYVGIVKDQLCIFFCCNRDNDLPCNNIWAMRSCKGERYWEKLPDNYEMKYQVVHYMKNLEFTSSMKIRMSFFCDDNKCLSRAWFNIKSPLFVPSLVSPYAGRPSRAKNNKTSVKSWFLTLKVSYAYYVVIKARGAVARLHQG